MVFEWEWSACLFKFWLFDMFSNYLSFFLDFLVYLILVQSLSHCFLLETYLKLNFLLHFFESARQNIQMRLYHIKPLLHQYFFKVFLVFRENIGTFSGLSSQTFNQANQFFLGRSIFELFFGLFLPIAWIDRATMNWELDDHGFENKKIVFKYVMNIFLHRGIKFIYFS